MSTLPLVTITPHHLEHMQTSNVKLMISVCGHWGHVMGWHSVQINLMLNYATLTSGVLMVLMGDLPSMTSEAPLLPNIQNVYIMALTMMEDMIQYPEETKI